MASKAAAPAASSWRAEMRATLTLAYPLILANLTGSLIQATDVVMLGWVGPSTLAAATLGSNIYTAFMIFGMGLVIAASPMMAREIGRKANSVRDVRRTVRQAMWVGIAVTVPMSAILWNTEAILLFLGQDPQLSAGAAIYVRTLQWGLLPFLFYTILRSFVAALERPNWALLVGVLAVLFNAAADYLLIFGWPAIGLPPMGLFGAALASAFTNLLMFLGMAAVVTIQPRFRRYRLFGRFWRADWERFRAVWRLGLPIAVTIGLEITIFNAAVFLMGLIGTAALAAHAIALQIAALTFMVPLGLSQAVTVRVGLACGRRDRDGIRRAGWTAFILGVAFMAAMAALMIAFPYQLVGLFLDMDDPANAAVVPLAISFMFIAALFQIFDGAQSVGAGMLRGLHDTTVPMLFAAFGYWVVGLGVALGFGFGLGWGGVGIWTGLATGLAVVALLMIARWMRRENLGLAQ